MDAPLPARTLTDADAEAIASRLHALLRLQEAPRVAPSLGPVEFVRHANAPMTDANRKALAAASGVTAENAAWQDLPPPMLKALLAEHARQLIDPRRE